MSKQHVFADYDIPDDVAVAFADSLREHIAFVQEAGVKIGVPPIQIFLHDMSKWSREEFPGYAMHFKGGGVPDAFSLAWLHHIHHNPHHWQHWIFSDGFTPKGSAVESGCVEMPQNYALEMVADWMGASMAYTASWDMADWLWKNIPKIRVHSRTAAYLQEVLDGLGYADVVNMMAFGDGID